MSIIIFGPGPPDPPVDPTPGEPEDLQSAAEDYYARLYPLHAPEPENGYALMRLADAISTPVQPVHEVLQETDTHRAWEIILDPDFAPAAFLPWLQIPAGVRLLPSDTEAQQRARIKQAAGLYAGTEQAIRDEMATTLVSQDPNQVRIVYPSQWAISAITRTADTPDVAATTAAAKRQEPAGFLITTFVSDEPLIDEFTRDIDSITAVIDSLTLSDVT